MKKKTEFKKKINFSKTEMRKRDCEINVSDKFGQISSMNSSKICIYVSEHNDTKTRFTKILYGIRFLHPQAYISFGSE